MPQVTALYAGLLGLMLIFLSWRVVRLRRGEKVGMGDGGNKELARAIRVQAQSLRREHRRRLRQALRGLRALKPLCAPELRPLWIDTIDSAILLLHLNARDFHGTIDGVKPRASRAPRA